MTVKVDDNGDFVQIASTIESNVVSDLYDKLSKDEKSNGSLAHEVRKSLGIENDKSTELGKWCKLLTSAPVVESNDNHDGTLGAAFYHSTDYTASEYNDYDGKYESISTVELSETEYAHQKDELVNAGIIDESETVLIPTTSDGDVLPVIACSNERDEAHPTFEYAKETLLKLMNSYFDEVEVVESNDTDDSGSDGGSDTEEDFFLNEVHKVGPETSKNLKETFFEQRAILEFDGEVKYDWRNDVDGEEWHNQPTIITESEAELRLNEVADQLSEKMFDLIHGKIKSEGEMGEAVTMIENFE